VQRRLVHAFARAPSDDWCRCAPSASLSRRVLCTPFSSEGRKLRCSPRQARPARPAWAVANPHHPRSVHTLAPRVRTTAFCYRLFCIRTSSPRNVPLAIQPSSDGQGMFATFAGALFSTRTSSTPCAARTSSTSSPRPFANSMCVLPCQRAHGGLPLATFTSYLHMKASQTQNRQRPYAARELASPQTLGGP